MKVRSVAWLIAAAAAAAVALTLGVTVAVSGTTGGIGGGPDCRGKAQLERNKQNVVAYYTMAFNDKNPREAVRLYGGPEYIQHNPLAANGFDAFIAFVEGFTSAFPDVHIEIKRVIAECDLVVTHGLLTGAVPVFGPRGSKVVDIFRLNDQGKVVEHWDVSAQISETSANGNPEV
jgi:predicted SnoaL-like aldol condensation-catalyzing enzyme